MIDHKMAMRVRIPGSVSPGETPWCFTATALRSILALLTLAASVAVATPASADQRASPNKYVAAASDTGLDLKAANSPGHKTVGEMTATRKKRMLVVHAAAQQNTGNAPQTVSLSVKANGIPLEPGTVSNSCVNGFCSVSATFFLDMDQAEAAHPGVFFNAERMIVEAFGISTTSGGNGSLSLVSELLKKN